MRVLVTCVPQAGHLNPMLPLIAEFVRGGDEVVVATGDAVREPVERLGARFEAAGKGLDAWFAQLASRTRGAPGDGLPPERIAPYFVPRLFAEIATADMVDDVLAAGEKLRPDVVLFDTEAFVGPLAARLLDARSLHHSLGPSLPDDVLQLVTDALSPLWRSFGLDVPADAGLHDGVTVAVCPPTMDRSMPHRGARLLLRPAPLPTRPASPQTPPLVYFTLGTLWGNREVASNVLDALGRLPVRVLATGGTLDPAALPAVPPNVELQQFVPQADVLPDASLVVHHAGAGTMFGALAHGLPQVALPQAADNYLNAEMLARAGAGVVLKPPEVTPDAVETAVTAVLRDHATHAAARTIAAEIAAMPSPAEVTDTVRNRWPG